MYKSFGQVNEYLPASRPFHGYLACPPCGRGPVSRLASSPSFSLRLFAAGPHGCDHIAIWLIKYECGAGARLMAPWLTPLFAQGICTERSRMRPKRHFTANRRSFDRRGLTVCPATDLIVTPGMRNS